LKAIAYFLVHQNPFLEDPYTKREAVHMFLANFPSERKNLEEHKILRYTKSKGHRNF